MFKLSILDIQTAAPIFQGLVECVVLPGQAGELSFLGFHQSIILKLKEGVIKVDNKGTAIKEGIAKMENNKVDILVERAQEEKEEILKQFSAQAG
jgi:F0F1-type ATP synthase epsilon subunit